MAHNATEAHNRYLALMARLLSAVGLVAATLTLGAPGRVEPEPAEMSTSDMGLFP